MAKWGEGDPRWIVEERPDATNVNNWHWTERNAGPWSNDRIRDIFTDLEYTENFQTFKITEIEQLEGEASANNRKGKLIFFYEWNIILKWEGHLHKDDEIVEGKITIPNLSEENGLDEIDIIITIKTQGEKADRLKDFMYTVGRKKIRECLDSYISSLRIEFSKGMILPKKDDPTGKGDCVSTITSGFNKKINMTPIESTIKSNDAKIAVTTLKLNHKFQCTPQEFYDAMTRVEMVTAFTRGAVKLDATKEGEFVLFGGNITGTFKELVPAKRIVQTWRYKPWPKNHVSIVTIDIEKKSDHTDVSITQVGVPTEEAETTRCNWDRYYWESMKRTFGFGAFFTN